MRNLSWILIWAQAAVAVPQILAKLTVGDKDLSGLSEDGLYRITYDQLMQLYKAAGKENQLSGLSVQDLALATSSVDSISLQVLGPIRSPYGSEGLHPVALEVRDHSAGGKGSPNQTFDSGDTLVFYGQGTSRWMGVPSTDPLYPHIPWGFVSSPYSFERSYYLVLNQAWALRPSILQNSGGTPGEILMMRRFEKDSLLRDLYYRSAGLPAYDDLESGREFHWIWQDVSKGDSTPSKWSWSGLERGHLQGAVLDQTPSKAWLQLSFFPDERRRSGPAPIYNGVYPSDALKRFASLEPKAEVNGRSWSQVILGQSGFLGEVQGLGQGKNQLSFSIKPNDWEMRLDGLSLFWMAPANYKGQSTYPYYVTQSSGQASLDLSASSTARLLRLDGGEWYGGYGQSAGVWGDSIALDRHWALVNDSLRTPGLELWNRPSGVVKDLEQGQSDRTENPALMLICPQIFVDECLEYRQYRQSRGVPTAVVVAEDIYASYNAGQASPGAIRDYLRYARGSYARNLRSVLLVGDGHVDPRQVTGKWATSYLPALSVRHMASDDYYALLDSGKALSGLDMPLSSLGSLSLITGRVPVQKVGQLRDYLTKVRNFESKAIGPWAQKALLLSDDAWQSGKVEGIDHLSQSEDLSQILAGKASWLKQQKIYLQDYEADAAGKKFAANRDLVRALSEGRYLVNYFGHGGANVLSDEGLFDPSTVANLGLGNANSIFSAFSCLVGRFDSPRTASLMEDFVRKTPSGGIATIAAQRESESGGNSDLANWFYKYILSDSVASLGRALYLAKLSVQSMENAQHYALLGDPELELIHPQSQLQIKGLGDTIQALMPVTLNGEVPGISEGKISLFVQNQSFPKSWVADDGKLRKVQSADLEGSTIYSELIPIHHGTFKSEFITPRKMNFGDTNVKLLAFAWSEDGTQKQALARSGILIHGTSAFADSIRDTLAPTLAAYPCKTVGRTPLGQNLNLSLPLCVEFEVKDNLALDFSTGADEGIDVQWVGEESPWHPEFLEQTGKSAVFRVTLENAKLGTKQLRIRALDVLGNQVQKTWSIQVNEKQGARLFDVYTQPNPMRNSTVFQFKTAGLESATFTVRIFDQAGYLVRVLNQVKPGVSTWDGRDAFGNLLANGLYFYKVSSSIPLAEDKFGATQYQVMSALQRLVISR